MKNNTKIERLAVVLFKGDDYAKRKEAHNTAQYYYCVVKDLNENALTIRGEAHAVICCYNKLTGKNATLKEVKQAIKNDKYGLCIFQKIRY